MLRDKTEIKQIILKIVLFLSLFAYFFSHANANEPRATPYGESFI